MGSQRRFADVVRRLPLILGVGCLGGALLIPAGAASAVSGPTAAPSGAGGAAATLAPPADGDWQGRTWGKYAAPSSSSTGSGGSTGSSSTTGTGATTDLTRSWSSSQYGQNGNWGDQSADQAATDPATLAYDAKRDPGSLYTLTKTIGARDVWAGHGGRGITGDGVTVALLDTGTSPVPGLDRAGKLIKGPDLTPESSDPDFDGMDSYGHGTHLAGIIAAQDGDVRDPADADAGQQVGVAPGASLLSLKLASADGSTDVSQVIAALDWVVTHRNDDPANPIRVVNLSYGTHSAQSYLVDPLAAAAENAWRHGIVVVTAGGNDGREAERLTNPAIDPYVISVGATSEKDKSSWWSDVHVADFSSRGDSTRSVDLVAPGTSIASLRDPGSFVDITHPEGLVAGEEAGRLFRGSGTSQAAAVVSGAVALLLEAEPRLTPDQVKHFLTSTADPVTGATVLDAGAGTLDILDAVKAASALKKKKEAPVQTWARATGQGSIEEARGGSHVHDPANGHPLTGEVDVQGLPFSAAAWAQRSAAGTAWQGGSWLDTIWTGGGWSTADGAASTLAGARWTGARWTGARWTAAAWSGARWTGARWTGTRWTGARWTGARWTGARWTDASWGTAGAATDSAAATTPAATVATARKRASRKR